MAPEDAGMDTPLTAGPDPQPEADGEAAPVKARRNGAGKAPRKGRGKGPGKGRGKVGRRQRKKAAGGAGASDGPVSAGLSYAGRISGRVLIFIVLVQLFLGLTVVFPFWHGISQKLDHHPHAAALAGSPTAEDLALGWEAGLDPGIWRDVKRDLSGLFESLTFTHFWVAIVAWLFGSVVAGGFLGSAVSAENPVRVGAFLTHGAKWFGRMLRVGIVFGCFYYVVARLVIEAWGGSVQPDESMAASEASGWWGERLREFLLLLCFFWFRIAADLARAELVVFGRKSALGAAFRGLGGALRWRSIRAALVFGVPALVLLLLLGFAAQALTGDGVLVLITLFLVFQVAVAIRWAARAGLLAAYAHMKRSRVEGEDSGPTRIDR